MSAPEKAWIITVLMGLGHLRAAYPLRRIAHKGLLVYGSRQTTPPSEFRLWQGIRRFYYGSSRAGAIPVIGKAVVAFLLAVQNIPRYYPRSDQSRPNAGVRYLKFLMKKRRLGLGLWNRLATAPFPAVHTYFATAIAMDRLNRERGGPHRDQYVIICDADFNRVWVAEDPKRSHIRYLAPCTQVKRRLLAYGVPEKSVHLTGFPLPKENIGSEEGMEILKTDLFDRLLRLDPSGKFFSYHRHSVLHWLGRKALPPVRKQDFGVMFAVGGAGAQVELVKKILAGLAGRIRAGEIQLTLSCGIMKRIFERVLGYIHRAGLGAELDRGVRIIYDQDVYAYLDRFNAALRRTDVLWTKPSELTFYCGLGLPILMADPIGAHEELNKRWLGEIHAGLTPPGPLEASGEWLFDLRESGRLAEAAWDGFLKARTLGSYKIERLVLTGQFSEGSSPLEQ
ncbi:MAG: hypothetical protein JW843_03425 [Candidatus Aminicenantes bacterium]|nr:hypothetical protein [Candidatus Aminicenantes bacterium]